MRIRILNNIIYVITGWCFGVAFVDFQVGLKRAVPIAIVMGVLALTTALITKEEN